MIFEEEIERDYGPLRPDVKEAVEKHLECGILENGFKRVVCGTCKEEFGSNDEIFDLTLLFEPGSIETAWQGRPGVEVLFTEEGSRKFAEITGANVNKRMAILVDGKLVTAPLIRAKISGGRAIINGIFTHEEAERIARGIIRE